LNTSNGANLPRGETSSYPPFASTGSAVHAVCAVRCFVTSEKVHSVSKGQHSSNGQNYATVCPNLAYL